MKKCCPKNPEAKGQLASNILSPKRSLEACAYGSDVCITPMRQNALIHVTGIQESFLCSDS